MTPRKPLPLPELTPTPQEISGALTRVRARRTRSGLMGVAAAAVGAVAVAAVTAGGGMAADSLHHVDPVARPTATSTASPLAAQTPAAARRDAPPGADAAPTGPVVLPTSALSPSPRPASSYAPAKRAGYRARPTMTRVFTQAEVSPSKGASSGRFCSAGEVTGPDDTWCLYVDVSYSGSTVRMQYDVCRSGVVSGPAQLTFDLVVEADFAIRKGAREVWRWSAGQAFARNPHSLSVESSGACYVWHLAWDGVLDDGRELAAGEYTVTASSASNEIHKTTSAELVVR